MNESAFYVLAGLTVLAGVFITWNKIWGIAKRSISTDVSIEQDARCNKRIKDLTLELKEAILPMSEDVTQIRQTVSELRIDHQVLKGEITTINATMTAMSGHIDAVDAKASRAEKQSNDNRVTIAGLNNGG